MNAVELNILSEKSLSNEARVLYILYLCKEVHDQSQKVTIKNKQISNLLNTKSEVITRGRQITALLIELVNAGLISTDFPIDTNRSMNNIEVSLPFATTAKSNDYFKMTSDWQPDKEHLNQLSTLVGLIDDSYTVEELGEFLAYWITREEIQLTSFQWTQKLVTFLKQRRLRTPKHQEDTKQGHQYAQPEVSVNSSDSAKKLVEKYKK